MSPIFTSDLEDISLVTEEAEKELKREKFLEFIVGVSPCLLCAGYNMNKGKDFNLKACLMHQ